ncbi:hypothetical protein ZWY2020_040893 [Hordeum vulgare]|nr:hypothetical protein ZWY2020_040893 [Hordeum vulgare]
MPGIQSMSVLPSSPLAYREAVLLVDPSEPQFKGEVEDKYQYTLDTKDNMVHGWVTAGRTRRLRVVTQRMKFKSGRSARFTSHASDQRMSVFHGTHYVGDDIVARIGDDEKWKKVMGPVFVCLNSNSKNGDPRAL